VLDECFKSIYENVPVNRLIVVDGSSTDATLEIVKKFAKKHRNIRVITENGTRAKAREKGIREVETDWFMFVDSDVVLCKDWFKKAAKFIGDNVGAVWGLNIDVIPNTKNKLLLKLLGIVARKCFDIRGGTHDILIRSNLVKGIRFPESLHVYEDAYIVNLIKRRGYRVVVGNNLYCLHLKPPEDWSLKSGISRFSLEMKCGPIQPYTLKSVLYYPFFVLYWFIYRIRNR
jgi:glycosyltransferase involved in cell wall biosynthesis